MSGNAPVKKDPRAWNNLAKPLSPWILDAINTMGYERMTPVQASAIPLFMGNKDVVVEVRNKDTHGAQRILTHIHRQSQEVERRYHI